MLRRMRRFFLSIKGFWLAAAALSLLLLISGCGDSNDSASGSSDSGEVTVKTGSLSKAEFIKQASTICEETVNEFEDKAAAYLKELEKNPPKPGDNSGEAELVESAFVPAFQSQIDQISELGAPKGDEKAVSAFLTPLQQIVDEASADPTVLASYEGELGEAEKLADAYGLPICAQPSEL